MDINKLKDALRQFKTDTMESGDFRRLEYVVSEGRTPEKKKVDVFIVPNRDFEFDGKSMFTAKEAFTLQDLGAEFGLRLPRAHEWRGIGFWITHNGEYIKKFNLSHDGHTWEGTDIPQNQDGGAYYWSGSSDKDRNRVRAVSVLKDGTFDINFRSPDESMRVRLIIDPVLLEK